MADIVTSAMDHSTTTESQLLMRLPSALPSTSTPNITSTAAPDFQAPSSEFLLRTWHVTHSTLPMWKNKRNVRITYASLPDAKLSDTITYQSLSSASVSKAQGVDTPRLDVAGGCAYTWRGKGWLRITSSKWELLGWGEEKVEGNKELEKWAVTYFAKSMFTPAGIDIYAATKEGLSESTVDKIKHSLLGIAKDAGKDEFAKMVNELFEVKMDGDMPNGAGA